MRAKITKRTVDALKPGESDLWVADSEVEGFGVRVRPTGSKSYFLRYRVQGERRFANIGKHGSPWSPDMARKEAMRLLGLVVGGKDPKVEANNQKNDMTVSTLCDRYIEDVKAGQVLTRRGVRKSASTIATDNGRIERHIKPLLGRKKIKSITRKDIVAFRDAVTSGATRADIKTGKYGRAIVKGGSGTATRTLGLLSGIFAYAVRNMMRDDNPVHGVERASDKRKLISLSSENYAAIGKALRALEKECAPDRDDAEKSGKTGKRVALSAIQALLLSGCRKSEILSLKKSEVDLSTQCFRLVETKSGEQVRPIGRTLAEFLGGLDFDEESEWVFPASRGDGHIVGVPKVWNEVRKMTGLAGVTLHTARHGFASVAAELGYSEITIAGLLGHRSSSVTGRYIHLVDPALIAAANGVSGLIESRMGEGETDNGNVVEIGTHALR